MKKHENADTSAAKTIAVVDEAGNTYEATYLKRAKGLVKHGRARFISENTICLACPPDNIKLTEDNSMTNTENYVVDRETGEVTMPETEAVANESKYKLEYFLEQIEKITAVYSGNTTEYIIGAIASIQSEGTPAGGSGDEIARAAAEAVRYREQTVQKTLDFYFRMVDELKPKAECPIDEKTQFLNWVRDCTAAAGPGVATPDYARLWNEMK